jgi:hypothetical protein
VCIAEARSRVFRPSPPTNTSLVHQHYRWRTNRTLCLEPLAKRLASYTFAATEHLRTRNEIGKAPGSLECPNFVGESASSPTDVGKLIAEEIEFSLSGHQHAMLERPRRARRRHCATTLVGSSTTGPNARGPLARELRAWGQSKGAGVVLLRKRSLDHRPNGAKSKD